MKSTPERQKAKSTRRQQPEEPTTSDSNIPSARMALIKDDFIDDDTFEFPPVQHATAKSRHFGTNKRQETYEQKDIMPGCDDFERQKADDLFDALKRLRNNVCHHESVH